MNTKLPIKLSGCEVSPVSIKFPDHTTLDEWNKIGLAIGKVQSGIQWWIGDWIVFGERKFKSERLTEASALSGYSYDTLYNCNYVSLKVPISRRREILSWSHHQEVASLDEVEQQKWLSLAERHNLSRRALRASIRAGKVITDEQLKLAGTKTGGVVSLVGLSVKFQLWLMHAPKVETMPVGELTAARERLQPFVEMAEQIEHRLSELQCPSS